ncbi:hypothetical protein H4R18_001015 [Coemansia javaensis]|uniref:Uncharacterized protein n=1 Tax=Coemansia javaensis TaxID=2761396 RepID=A0A9W8HEB0_9FUNG|nr:hypothetical protein H4R18_001015 [Coemansia javaensis]
MADAPGKGTANIALFVAQIVSAASGFVISASCLFLRKWHPPVAYTAAFNISFWIGVQAMITHTGSAISVRLPEASEEMQRSKALVRFLVWAQFAMPLWFVFLNASIATDLMLSQLCRLSATRLQAIHKWYLPVATSVAFALALPLLIYHSTYQPAANVFSVQFPSALSVTLYYILAFDIWLAVGILYCFVVVSMVVGVLLVKLRRKRAAWRLQNMGQVNTSWLPPTPGALEADAGPRLGDRHETGITIAARASDGSPHDCVVLEAAAKEAAADDGLPDAREHACERPAAIVDNDDCGSQIDASAVCTFAQPAPADAAAAAAAAATQSRRPALVSGVTFSDAISSAAEGDARTTLRVSTGAHSAPADTQHAPSSRHTPEWSQAGHGRAAIVYTRVPRWFRRGAASGDDPSSSRQDPAAAGHGNSRSSSGWWWRGRQRMLSLSGLVPLLTPRTRTQSPAELQLAAAAAAAFRIPTLALVRLLLYPLIPILSFTLMCVVRWVWFRSALPSRWEILNVVSGFLRAFEGFLCLIVFLLNPALNRSFREIRKRNTPVFT